MLMWFRENAPIRQKLSIVFGLQAIWIIIAALSCVATHDGLISLASALVINGGILLCAVVSGLFLRAAIADPYVATVVRMEALAAGDVASTIRFTQHRDCVGRMTNAMHAFREAALARQRAEDEAAKQRAEADALRDSQQRAREAAAAQQAFVVDHLSGGLASLAAGDLTVRLQSTFAEEYEALRGNFNDAVAKLQSTMHAVVTIGSSITAGTVEISKASDDLSRRTEQQAASLEQTAAALDQITATVRRTAEGSVLARKTVSSASEGAAQSGRLMEEAVQAMGAIETSANEIGAIIGTIDEIAFQTNLLALNAGVEAARAGDAGRGFAVVASEVRALAQRAADAAREIKTLISTSSRQVTSGVELVVRTGTALESIVAQISEVSGVVSGIAASAQEQATALAEVNTAVNQMDQVTQQNAAMVEQTTAASHSLQQETDGLASLLETFKLDSVVRNEGRGSVERSRLPGRPMLKSTKQKGPPTKPLAMVADDDWREF